MKNLKMIVTSVMFFAAACTSQNQERSHSEQIVSQQKQITSVSPNDYHSQKATNKLFVIEREMPGAGD